MKITLPNFHTLHFGFLDSCLAFVGGFLGYAFVWSFLLDLWSYYLAFVCAMLLDLSRYSLALVCG